MKESLTEKINFLISDLKEREREVILRRFGIGKNRERETLEKIGKSFKITRERVRQIEKKAKSKILEKISALGSFYEKFVDYFKKCGGLKREDILLKELGEGKFENEIFFLLSIKKDFFFRFPQTTQFHSFWAIDKNITKELKSTIDFLVKKLEEKKKLFSLEELANLAKIETQKLKSFLEVSKIILTNKKNLFGLKNWPEIRQKTLKERAYVTLKEFQKPLHFKELAKMLGITKVESLHNELIKDSNFVLIGRGIYALREWGFIPGETKEVILEILKKEKKPLTKEEIVEKVLKQRVVKVNTILQCLRNREIFQKDSDGKYWIREA